jgi:transcriptional regulator with XRE-family HTH domain
MTQAELATRAGITQAAISNIIGSPSRQPSARTLFGLARALACSPDFILFGVGEPFDPVALDGPQVAELVGSFRALHRSDQGTLMVFARLLKSGPTFR